MNQYLDKVNPYHTLFQKLIETHELMAEDGSNPQLEKLMKEYNTNEFVVIYRKGNECPFQFYVPTYDEHSLHAEEKP